MLTEGFRRTSVMRERAIPVIIEYVPVLHSPDTLVEKKRLNVNLALMMVH